MAAPRSEVKTGKEDDFEFYLKSGLSSSQVATMLELQKKDSKEIAAFIAKYEESRRKIAKMIRKFVEKISEKYGQLETAELIRKGIKFAVKNKFSEAEKVAFLRFVVRGDIDNVIQSPETSDYTEMSKFFGFSRIHGSVVDIKPQEIATLNEIVRLYETTRALHMAVKNQSMIYESCAPEVIHASYDKAKHNAYVYINPVIAMMFIPKIELFEKRMINLDIGRFIVSHAQQYLRKTISGSFERYDPEIIRDEYMFALEMANDPNALPFLTEESPIINLLKRYKIQIELWKNISNLRQGKIFSSGDYDANDFISNFYKAMGEFEYAEVTSPDTVLVHDEASILRKILHVFAIRPTYTLYSPINNVSDGALRTMNVMSQQLLINTPMVTINLSLSSQDTASTLESFLKQDNWIMERKSIVLKRREVAYSKDLVIFNINRKQQSTNIAKVIENKNKMDLTYQVTLPLTISSYADINTANITYSSTINVGKPLYEFVSAIVAGTDTYGHTVNYDAVIYNKDRELYYRYHPSGSVKFLEDLGKNMAPITLFTDDQQTALLEMLSCYATLMIYKQITEN